MKLITEGGESNISVIELFAPGCEYCYSHVKPLLRNLVKREQKKEKNEKLGSEFSVSSF